MPSLIRFVVFLIFLAGLVFAGMIALTVFVDPGHHEITRNVPVNDFMGNRR